jgi:tripartite-type tricarboxylate transporter receptor subunit TctC
MTRLRTVFTSLLILAGAAPALAQDYPSKPIRVVVAYAAGGAADLIVRAVFSRLEAQGYQAVIENRAGGGTQIAAETVAKAAPDGYTLFATGMESFAISPFIYSKLSYDPKNDFAPVSGLGYANQILAVPAQSSITSIQDLVAKAKAENGQLQYGTIGMGGSAHINMVLFENLAGVKMTPLHFRGGAPMLTDLIGGHIPMGFLSVTLLHDQIASGKLRGLGVGSKNRIPQLPNVPTIDESGVPGFEAVSWFGLFAPRRTPDAVITKLNVDIQKVFADPDFKTRFLDPSFLGVITGTPDQFSAYINKEAEKWKKVIESANLKVN